MKEGRVKILTVEDGIEIGPVAPFANSPQNCSICSARVSSAGWNCR